MASTRIPSVPKEQATVNALRAKATDVDTTARRYGAPADESAIVSRVNAADFDVSGGGALEKCRMTFPLASRNSSLTLSLELGAVLNQ